MKTESKHDCVEVIVRRVVEKVVVSESITDPDDIKDSHIGVAYKLLDDIGNVDKLRLEKGYDIDRMRSVFVNVVDSYNLSVHDDERHIEAL